MALMPRARTASPRRPLGLGLLVAACALALGMGCSGEDEDGRLDPGGLLADEDPRIQRLLQPALGDPLERTPPILRVLVTHDSTNYFVDAGQQRGLEYELMRDFEEHLAERAPPGRLPPRLVFLTLPFDELLPSLLAGRGDLVAAGLTVTEERRRRVAFSAPYRRGVREVVVRHEESDPVETLEDLAGREVHVVRGSSYEGHLDALSERLRADGLAPVEVRVPDPNLRSEDFLQMVHAGIYDLTVVDDHIAKLWAQILDGVVVEDVAVHEGGRLAWAVRPDSETLKQALDAYARGRRQGTLVGNMLFRRYYDDTRWVEDPTDAVPRGRLRDVARHFRRSAERHGFDWLALAAVAFQESRFDPEARSAAGAVGIMQIRPATAADPHVGIDDVSSVEANVEAATRYLAFLRDRYFSSDDIPPAARFDFTIAAYNAGPARVRRLRKQAGRQGLDPDRWFGHVEHVARAEIGRETYTYVTRVNQVYAALRSVRHQLEARDDAVERHGGG